MALPIFKNMDQPFQLMQSQWASQLNPVLANPMTNIQILENISLVTGTNVINHKLNQTQQGWMLVDLQGAVIPYRNAPFNSKTLSLFASGPVICSIGVF